MGSTDSTRSIIVVVGGAGALGSAFLARAVSLGRLAVCIDLVPPQPNPSPANCLSLVIDGAAEEADAIIDRVKRLLPPRTDAGPSPVQAVVCTAGSWRGGSMANASLNELAVLQASNLRPSLLAVRLAHALSAGCLVLTSAAASLHATPDMLAYGAIKAAVNHLAESVASAGAGPKHGREGDPGTSTRVVVLLPQVLDTPENRKYMDVKQAAGWTRPSVIAEHLLSDGDDLLAKVSFTGSPLLAKVLIKTVSSGETLFQAIQ